MQTSANYLTIKDAADQLGMTPDGVRKLISRDKLKAVRLSERKIVISRAVLAAYQRRLNNDVLPPQINFIDPAEDKVAFERATGRSPAAWLEAWKREEIDDTAENMRLMVRAAALRAAELAENEQQVATASR
jgi:excisionase family DNA binding protein